MADFKISELTNHTPASSDDMIINDNSTPSSPETKRTTVASLASTISSIIGGGGGGESGPGVLTPFFASLGSSKTQSIGSDPFAGNSSGRNWVGGNTNVPMPPTATSAVIMVFQSTQISPRVSSGNVRAYGDYQITVENATFRRDNQGTGETSNSTIMGSAVNVNLEVVSTNRRNLQKFTKFGVIDFTAGATVNVAGALNMSNAGNLTLTAGAGQILVLPYAELTRTPKFIDNDPGTVYATDEDEYRTLVEQYIPQISQGEAEEEAGRNLRTKIFSTLSLIDSYASEYPAINTSEIAEEKTKLMNILTGATDTSDAILANAAVDDIITRVYGLTISRFGFELHADPF